MIFVAFSEKINFTSAGYLYAQKCNENYFESWLTLKSIKFDFSFRSVYLASLALMRSRFFLFDKGSVKRQSIIIIFVPEKTKK